MKKNKVKNNISSHLSVKNTTSNDTDNYSYLHKNMVVDFSFIGVFLSVSHNDFDNYLLDSNDFVNNFKKILINIQKLSTHTMQHLFSNPSFDHCHKIKEPQKAFDILFKVFNKLSDKSVSYDQEVSDEDFYQLGIDSPIRLFDTVHGNIFRVYFIDYYHTFSYNQTKNKRNSNQCKFSLFES